MQAMFGKYTKILISALCAGLFWSGTVSAQVSDDVPEILPRSTWETPELAKLVNWVPVRGGASDEATTGSDALTSGDVATNTSTIQKVADYAPVERLVIHDTGCVAGRPGCNNKDLDALTIIQGIFRFHAATRGWGDIGYHYVIDYDGKIYEGRLGGNGVRGAHLYYDRQCQNFNLGTIGIALLGNYQNRPVPSQMLESLQKLVAWLGVTNSLDLTKTDLATSVWTNAKAIDPKTGVVKCDISRGGYNSSFLGATVLTHHDIEVGNPDVASLDLASLRRESTALQKRLETMVFESTDGSGFYALGRGVLRKIASSGAPTGQLPQRVSASQLLAYPLFNPPRLTSGTLVTVLDAPDEPLYLIEGNERRAVYAKELLSYYNLSNAPTQNVRQLDLSGYPIGKPLIFTQNVILRSLADDTLYLIENGLRRHIAGALIYDELKFPGLPVIAADPRLIAAHEQGASALQLPENSLIKSTNSPDVYLVKNNQRLIISSAPLFIARGFSWSEIIAIKDSEILSYPFGGFVHWPTGSVLKPFERPEVYLVVNDTLRWIKTPSVFAKLGIKHESIIELSLAEVRSYNLTEPITVASNELKFLVKRPKVVSKLPFLSIAAVAKAIRANFSSLLANPALVGSLPAIPASPRLETQKEPKIRVALCWQRQGVCPIPTGKSLEITGSGPFRVIKSESILGDFNGGITVSASATPGVKYRFESKNESDTFEVKNFEDRPNWNQSLNDNVFRGAIELITDESGEVWLVNELPLEAYLAGIAEIVNEDAVEFKKVLLTAARSYAMHYLMVTKRYANAPFTLKNIANDQIYRGYNYEKRSQGNAEALKATRGQVIVYNDVPIVAAYSSDSGGVTKPACQIFGGRYCKAEFGYLNGGVNDPPNTVHNQAATAASHGVGLGNAGARQMISDGLDYGTVLPRYYLGTLLKKLYD